MTETTPTQQKITEITDAMRELLLRHRDIKTGYAVYEKGAAQ